MRRGEEIDVAPGPVVRNETGYAEPVAGGRQTESCLRRRPAVASAGARTRLRLVLLDDGKHRSVSRRKCLADVGRRILDTKYNPIRRDIGSERRQVEPVALEVRPVLL